MKCAVLACSAPFDEYGSYDFEGTKVCGMCYATFNWIEKNEYQLGSL